MRLTWTPEIYAHFPRGTTDQPYFTGMKNAVPVDPVTLAKRTFNFHNAEDYALDNIKAWPGNQTLKPDSGWDWNFKWHRTVPFAVLYPQSQTDAYEIFAHIAQAQSKALGCSEDSTHVVRGEIGGAVNLGRNTAFNFQDRDYEHSAQFRSINVNRRSYWWQVLNTFSLTNNLPTP